MHLPRNRDDILSLRHHPRQRQLRRRNTLLARHLLDGAHQLQVPVKVLWREPRHDLPHVAFLQVAGALDGPREHASAEGTICDDGDAELARRGEKVDFGPLDVEREGRVFDLES